MYKPSLPTILVVEPHPILGAIIRETLKTKFHVITQTGATGAYTFLFSGNLPDLIIVDFCRKQLDIQELVFELQQNQFFNKIPLLLISSAPSSPDETPAGRDTESTCLILKPFNPLQILAHTERILNRSAQFP